MNKLEYDDISETVYTSELDNGLTVHLLPRPEMSKTYGVFSTDYGSIDRTFTPLNQDERITVPDGIAHFLEHKMFEKEDRDVFEDFSKQGASPNAFTSFTETAYLFSATTNIKDNVTTLLDFVQDPYFSEQSVEKEKGIIAQEINMYEDQPDSRAFTETLKAMFEQHPVNIDIAGTVESIQAITKDDLYTCYNTFYHPVNMNLVIAGHFEPEEMMDLIKQNQDSKTFPPASSIDRAFPEEPDHVAQKERDIHMPVSTPKCVVGIKESKAYMDGLTFAKHDLLKSMLMDYFFSESGVFYQALYQDNFVDDSFFYEFALERNFGFSFIGTNTTRPDEFAEKLQQLLISTQTYKLSKTDFSRMKKKKIGDLLMAMNSLEFTASALIHYQRMGVDLFNLVNIIQALTLDEAQSMLNNWITDDKLAVCKVLPEA